ncbi:MAG TPA: glutaredoxin [Brevundimonas sp.]|nr:glutaredoxin [Brevundimonas sp.]
MNSQPRKTAVLYRMVMPDHTCPYGLKARHLLRARGYRVEDHWLETREATDAFKAGHGVKTTPQTFIDGQRIGGYDDLRRFFGLTVREPGETSYIPVIAVFAATALLAGAATWATTGTILHPRTAE